MRLSLPGTTRAGATISIRFDNRPLEALEGETVAGSLSAAGILAFRHTLGGAPRGLHCGMGACQDCVVAIDGRIGQRACVTTVRAGMEIRSEPSPHIAPFVGTRPPEERSPEILVIGGGPAGLSAAI